MLIEHFKTAKALCYHNGKVFKMYYPYSDHEDSDKSAVS